MSNWKKALHFRPEQLDERGVHVFEIVWDIEAYDTFVCQVASEFGSELIAVSLLHDEDDLRPFY